MNISPPQVWRTRLQHYRLIGGYCKRCGKHFYPPRPSCPYCGSREVDQVELPRIGRVISYTIIHSPAEGFRAYAPLILALIELENGARVLAPLTDVEPPEVNVGLKVEAVFRRVLVDGDRGLIAYGLKFRPLRLGGANSSG